MFQKYLQPSFILIDCKKAFIALKLIIELKASCVEKELSRRSKMKHSDILG